MVNTWLQRSTPASRPRAWREPGRSPAAPRRTFVAALAARIGQRAGDSAQALLVARGEFARLVGRYALTSAFDEVFRLMAWMFLAALVMVPFCKPARVRPRPPPTPTDRPMS